MTDELELSIMAGAPGSLQPLLDEFEARRGIRVRLRLLSWDTAWSDLLKVALYSDGPDVSEIGSTWLGDLVAMNAVRPFSESEVASLGGAGAFLPSALQSARMAGGLDWFAIPWLTGARLVFYRRDLLDRAGGDARTAFHTAARFEETLHRLGACGVRVPFTVPTGPTHSTLLNVASWVWGAGGDFATADGKRSLFSQPQALAGMQAYFALGRYLSTGVRGLTGLEPDDQFLDDEDTAVTLSGSWLFERADPSLKARVGVALPPGASFVGGSHLVIWKHTARLAAALALVRFLTATRAQVAYSQRVGLLPATLDGLASPPFATDPSWQKAIEGLKTGRSFPVTRAWGLMEDRLTRELSLLWTDVFNNPGCDLLALIAKRLDPLARRLDLVLGQS
jgi:multiple sugar transport system substrate-binding protein